MEDISDPFEKKVAQNMIDDMNKQLVAIQKKTVVVPTQKLLI